MNNSEKKLLAFPPSPTQKFVDPKGNDITHALTDYPLEHIAAQVEKINERMVSRKIQAVMHVLHMLFEQKQKSDLSASFIPGNATIH